MTTDSTDGTVTNKSLFKAELDVHGQLEKVYATDTKRKDLMIQIMPPAACASYEKITFDVVIFVDIGRYKKTFV